MLFRFCHPRGFIFIALFCLKYVFDITCLTQPTLLDFLISKTREGIVTEDMLKKELRDLEMRLREQNTETPEGQEKKL